MVVPTPEGITTRPVGVDFTAVTNFAMCAGADLALLADVLPAFEAALLAGPEGLDDSYKEDDDA